MRLVAIGKEIFLLQKYSVLWNKISSGAAAHIPRSYKAVSIHMCTIGKLVSS